MVLALRLLRLASVLGLLLLTACSNIQMSDTQQPRVVPATTIEAPVPSQSVPPPAPDYGTVRATTPPVVTGLLNQAAQAISQKQWLTAERALEKALRIAPNEAKIYLTYGALYQQTGDNKQAQQMLLRALSLAGEHSPVGQSARTQLANLNR